MLSMAQNLLMAIYCIILSSQHKCRCTSVSVCQVGVRKTAPWSRQNSSDGILLLHRTPQGQQCDGPLDATVCLSVCLEACACVHSLAFVCTFLQMVVSSCPWVSIDRECGTHQVFLSTSLCESRWRLCGLQQGHTVTSAAASLTVAVPGQTFKSEWLFYNDKQGDNSKGLLCENRGADVQNTGFIPVGKNKTIQTQFRCRSLQCNNYFMLFWTDKDYEWWGHEAPLCKILIRKGKYVEMLGRFANKCHLNEASTHYTKLIRNLINIEHFEAE